MFKFTEKRYLSIGEVSLFLGLSISTLRRWEKLNKLIPTYRTIGCHRRYALNIVSNMVEDVKQTEKKNICYARVSSHDQKEDLKRQEQRLAKYCNNKKISFELISDLGSGINYKKKGLKKLIFLLITGQVNSIVLTHKDRLLRFGTELIFSICKLYGTEIIIIEDMMNQTFEQQLVANVIEIITVFSSKLYGSRSHKNKKKLLCA